MESRALGCYPRGSTEGVWSDSAWAAAIAPRSWKAPLDIAPELACDVARFGSDYTCIVVRWGSRIVHHERHNGWSTDRTAFRLQELAREYAARYTAVRPAGSEPINPKRIPVKVDGDGLGASVLDQAHGYRFVSVCASASPEDPAEFSNRRPELWFTTRRLAEKGRVDLSALPRDTLARLRQQAMAPKWKPRSGLIYVEPKEETKARLGFSPDDMDAINIAFARTGSGEVARYVEPADPVDARPKPSSRGLPPTPAGERQRPGLFGRRR